MTCFSSQSNPSYEQHMNEFCVTYACVCVFGVCVYLLNCT